MSITPDSVISAYKSLPSLVLSPTPANTENPPCSVAIFLINSCIRTVFPTPAPPNSPVFPPLVYGSIKSTTLIPVSNISEEVAKLSCAGADLWIGEVALLPTFPF